MSRWSLLNPFRIRDAARRIRETAGGGGPKAIRLAGVSHPEGWIIPTARITIDEHALRSERCSLRGIHCAVVIENTRDANCADHERRGTAA